MCDAVTERNLETALLKHYAAKQRPGHNILRLQESRLRANNIIVYTSLTLANVDQIDRF